MSNNFASPYLYMAEAYGEGLFSCGSYEEGCNTQTGAPGAPNTGLFGQPDYIAYPGLIGAALILGTLTFALSRKLRNRKK